MLKNFALPLTGVEVLMDVPVALIAAPTVPQLVNGVVRLAEPSNWYDTPGTAVQPINTFPLFRLTEVIENVLCGFDMATEPVAPVNVYL